MTATATAARHDPLLVRLSRALLTRTVRGSATEGTVWGEALLGELAEIPTTAETVRWTISSLPVAWRERRARRAADRATQPLRVCVTRRVVMSLAILLVAGVLVNVFVATIVYEPSPSMRPTYPTGSRLLVSKIGYHVTGLHYGDVVVVRVPHTAGGATTMIKRVIGLPGDAMACNSVGALTRNGAVVAGPANADDVPLDSPHRQYPNLVDCTPVTVPDGDIYLIGDAYFISDDSRDFGPVPASGVTGRVVVQVWPW